jgi:hypothetical protein
VALRPEASGSRGSERENINELCLLKTGNPSGTIERDIPSCSRGSERENETINDACVSGDELCLLETGNPSGTFDIPSGNPCGHFITRFINSTCAPHSSSWTALLTQSMSILSGRHDGESLTESIDNDQSFESCHTGRDVSLEVFVTPPSSPAATCVVLTPPSTLTSLCGPRALRPRLSDVFAAHVPGADPGSVPLTLGQTPAGPSGTLATLMVSKIPFIQINCGKRIAAMSLLESNEQDCTDSRTIHKHWGLHNDT